MAEPDAPATGEPLYLDDFHVGRRFASATHLIDTAQIKDVRAPVRSPAVPSRRGGCQAQPVRRPGGERLAYRGRHHAAAGRVGHAGRRRPHRHGRRDELAAADAARRCPACGERDQGGDAVPLAPGSRHGAHTQRNPQSARRGGSDSRCQAVGPAARSGGCGVTREQQTPLSSSAKADDPVNTDGSIQNGCWHCWMLRFRGA